MRSRLPRALLLALALLAFAAAVSPRLAPADETIRDPKVLADRFRALAHTVADSNASLGRRFDSRKCLREARDELQIALELEPDHKNARAALGWKREGDAWVGGPVALADSPGSVSAELEKERARVHDDAAKRLATLARAAAAGGQVSEACRIAALALEENPEDTLARDVLGHTRSSTVVGASWLSPREVALRAAFLEAYKTAPRGEAKKLTDDDELSKRLGLGALVRRDTPHVAILASPRAEERDVTGLARVAGATWAAHRYFLAGDPNAGFSVEGETAAAIGTGLLAKRPLALLFVHPDEHDQFLARGVADESERARAKGGAGWTTTIALGSGELRVCETAMEPGRRQEAAAHDVAWMLSFDLVEAADKEFVSEGLARFFSAHVTGRADVQYMSVSVTGGRAGDWDGGSIAELRARVRPAVRGLLPGTLRGLLERNLSDMSGEDVVRAFAFADFAITTHRSEYAKFVASLRKDELAATTAERAFGQKLEALEQELREWARAEY